MTMTMDRAGFLRGALACAGALAAGGCRLFAGRARRLALNPSTIREFRLPLVEQVRLAADAGWDGLEPWMKDLRAAKADGTLGEAVRIARGEGLAFVNGIAFGQWASSDGRVRAAGLEETKRDMALLAEIGCPTVAASMFGMHKPGAALLTTPEIAERYAAVLDLGRRMGVRPLLEYWGHSVNLNTPERALEVLRLLGRPDAAVLPDVYHTYRGGGDFATLAKFTASEMPVLHVNDYPLSKPRAALVDADRVWPGDGGADWGRVFAALDASGADPWLSLELFNLSYQTATPDRTVRTGLAKTRSTSERYGR